MCIHDIKKSVSSKIVSVYHNLIVNLIWEDVSIRVHMFWNIYNAHEFF